MWKNIILALLLCLILTVTVQADRVVDYDIDRDGDVTLKDIYRLTSAWLEPDCGLTNSCNGADIYPDCGDGKVSFGDFAAIAGVFGQCTDPTNPDCTHIPLTSYEPPSGGSPVQGVQPFSGEFTESVVDMRIGGRGLDFVWARKYRSQTGANTVMGNGWGFSYNIFVQSCSGNLIVHNGRGRRDAYYPQPDGTWKKEGFFRQLTQEADGSFTMLFPDAATWSFHSFSEPNAPGRISAIADRNGNTLSFEYDALGRLTTIHDTLDTASHNRDIDIAYDANGFIKSVTDWSGRQVQYAYYSGSDANGSAGDLKSVTTPAVTGTPTGNDFPSGKKTIYTYSKNFVDESLNHNILTITDPRGQIYLQNTYTADSVTRQIRGNVNDITDITYLQQTPDAANNYAVTRSIVNDRMGNVSEYFYDNMNRLVIERYYTGRADPNSATSIDPNVNAPVTPLRASDPSFYETRFQYNSDSLPTRTDFTNGNYVTNIYELNLDPNAAVRSRGNLREVHYFAGTLQAVSDQNEIVELFEYDPNFNLTTRYIDPRGNETLHSYDPNGNRIRSESVRPSEPNIVYQWEYDAFGRMTADILPDNGSGSRRRDEYLYYANPADPNYGYLKSVAIDANNIILTTAYEYDSLGRVTRTIDPRGNDTQYVVNQLNQVVRQISRDVNGVRYETDTHYDENDNVVRLDVRDINDQGVLQPDPNITTAYEYDILNRLTRTIAEVNSVRSIVTEYEYDDNSNLTLTRSGEAINGNEPNNVVRSLYDERDLLYRVTRAESDPDQSTTQYDYDGNGNVISVHEGLESTPHITNYQYDGYDRLIRVEDPMGNTTDSHYDPAGNVISERTDGELIDIVGDVNNIRLYETTYEYDTINRLTRTIVDFFDPNTQAPIGDGSSITDVNYSDTSQVLRVIDDNNNQTNYEYDTVNRRSLVTDAKGNTAAYAYDKNSNVIEVNEVDISDLSEPNEIFVTTYEYDSMDRLVRIIDNNSNATEYGYDSRDNRKRTTDAQGNETRYEYDGLDRLTRTLRDMDGNGASANDANDIKTGRTYDDNSRLTEQKDDNGNTTAYEYDALNRLVRTTFADGTNETSAYDVYDDEVGSVDAVGTASVMAYDRLHRLKRGTYSPGPGVSNDTTFEDYEYDGLSRLTFAGDDDSNLVISYDSLSNLVSETLNGETTASAYDGLGNKLSCTYPGTRTVTNSYDALNRLSTTSAGSYDYVGPARARRLTYNNTIQNDYSYDDVRRITGTMHSGSSVGIIDERSYSYDAIYNKTQRKDLRLAGPLSTHDYSYDAIYRLTNTAVTGSVPRNTAYSLDGVGNRTSAYTMDGTAPIPADFQMNQYTATPFDIREYDDNGNLNSIDSGLPTQKSIIYDCLNRIVEVSDVSTGQVHSYAYDAFGRRIRKQASGGGLPSTDTLYFYDGGRVIEEQDNTGATQATYVYGSYIDEVLSMNRGGMDYYYHTDDMYNVMAVTDSAGTVIERYEYGDYGQPDFVLSAGIENPYLFNGRRYDAETGLYYYRTRYLDPKAGRFVSRDTIGIWGDASNLGNGSAYVGNNPWTYLDPMGHKKKVSKPSSKSRKPCGCPVNFSCGGGHGGIAGLGGGNWHVDSFFDMNYGVDPGGGGGGGGGGGKSMAVNIKLKIRLGPLVSFSTAGGGGGGNISIMMNKADLIEAIARSTGGGGGGGRTLAKGTVSTKPPTPGGISGGGGAMEEITLAVEQLHLGISGGGPGGSGGGYSALGHWKGWDLDDKGSAAGGGGGGRTLAKGIIKTKPPTPGGITGGGSGGGISIMMNKAELIEAIARSTGGGGGGGRTLAKGIVQSKPPTPGGITGGGSGGGISIMMNKADLIEAIAKSTGGGGGGYSVLGHWKGWDLDGKGSAAGGGGCGGMKTVKFRAGVSLASSVK